MMKPPVQTILLRQLVAETTVDKDVFMPKDRMTLLALGNVDLH